MVFLKGNAPVETIGAFIRAHISSAVRFARPSTLPSIARQSVGPVKLCEASGPSLSRLPFLQSKLDQPGSNCYPL